MSFPSEGVCSKLSVDLDALVTSLLHLNQGLDLDEVIKVEPSSSLAASNHLLPEPGGL